MSTDPGLPVRAVVAPARPGGSLEDYIGPDRAEALTWLYTYEPRTVSPQVWSELRPFVMSALSLLKASPKQMHAYARYLTKLAAWCLNEGTPLDVELILDPETIERYCAVGLKGDPSAGTYRSTLRYLGRALTQRAPWDPRPAALTRRKVTPPYSRAEIRRLDAIARQQTTAARRRFAEALLVLGMGTGLSGRAIATVRGQDVLRVDGVVLVQTNDRLVPCLAAYEERLCRLSDISREELLIGGTSTETNRFGRIQASLSGDARGLRLVAPRLRSTWLVHHLAAGTRTPELMRAAGLQTITVLSDLLRFVPPMNSDEAQAERQAWRLLRGA